MTAHERVLESVGHRRPDRPPMELMATDGALASLCAHLGVRGEEEALQELGVDFRRFDAAIGKLQAVPGAVRERLGGEGALTASPYGVVLLEAPQFPQAHRVHGPLWQSDRLEDFDWPGPQDVEDVGLRQAIESCNRRGLCTLTGCDNPFKIGYFMRPYEDFLVDCLTRPEYVLELLRRIAAVEFARAEAGVRAGARAAMIFGDFADQRSLTVGPPTFRRVLKPLLAELCARLRAVNPQVLLFLHSDGNLAEVLDDLVEIGFQAVHPIQPECMDMAAVKRRYGKRLTLFGGVSVQTELPGSTPEGIRSLVRRRVDELGAAGGFILAPSNTILADTPPASVAAMYGEGARVL